ncbi:Hypothetical predicted protein [Olea europaea subsp. europaea]|uniref:Uncharacterized protein n=1 Tax=Olea europaea subsp. europaea TaxID=158383 RepID=A0A8S0SK42_OLEEU|nr:Hypothetical predicted protein [Olea europaea subsp. europaea]
MAMPYMNGVQYKKPVQAKFSTDSRRDKSRIERSIDRADPPVVGGSDKTKEVKTVEPHVDRKGKGKLDPTDDIVLLSTQPNILHSEDIQKHVDSVISDVVTTITTIDTEDTTTAKPTSELPIKRVSPFVAVEGKLFKHDDIVVFENYRGRVDEVDSSTFMAWKKFSDEDGRINPAFVIGSRLVGKSYRDWKVVKGIEPFVKILAALMNNLGISKKDPDYIEPSCMELKVTVDDTLPQ